MKNRSLLALFLVVFVDLLSFSFILPLIPSIATGYGLSPLWVGVLLAMFPIGQVFGAPVLGRLSDRFGRKPILLISVFGSFVSMLVLGFSTSIVFIFIARLTDGLTGANITIAQSYISDVTTPENRAKGLGLIGAAFGLGFIFGPAFGGILSQTAYGYHLPAFVAASLSFLNLVLITLILPESLDAEARQAMKHSQGTRFSLKVLWEALQRPKVGPLLHSRVFYSVAHGIFQTIFTLYAQQRLGLDASSTGLVLGYVGILAVLVQVLAIGRLTKTFSEEKLIQGSSLVLSLSYLAWALTPSLWVLLIVLIPISIASSVLNTVLRSTLTKSVTREEIGGILGLSTSLESMTNILTPILGGFLIGSIGTWSPGAFSALVTASLFFFVVRTIKPQPKAV
jgi:DHA1 family tetracycline resistance protein-like MFS transporter